MADEAPSPASEPPALSPGKWPFLAALLTVAAVGGGVVGAVVTAYLLREPGAMVAPGVHGEVAPALRKPVVAVRHDTETVPLRMNAREVAMASVSPLPDRAAPPRPRPRRSPAPVPAAPAPLTPPLTGDATAVSPGALFAASPVTHPDAASGMPLLVAASPPNGTSPTAPPEPQSWSDPFRPLSTGTTAHAGVAKTAFGSPTVSPVPAPVPPPTAPHLPAPRRVTAPAVASQSSEPAPVGPKKVSPPGASPEEDLRTAIREDWETVKNGFTSAPDDFRQAWRSLTRDLRGLLDR